MKEQVHWLTTQVLAQIPAKDWLKENPFTLQDIFESSWLVFIPRVGISGYWRWMNEFMFFFIWLAIFYTKETDHIKHMVHQRVKHNHWPAAKTFIHAFESTKKSEKIFVKHSVDNFHLIMLKMSFPNKVDSQEFLHCILGFFSSGMKTGRAKSGTDNVCCSWEF